MILDARGRTIDPTTIENIRRSAADRYPTDVRVPYTGRTTSGTYVTTDNVLMVSVAWACIRYLSQTTAMLPWRVHKSVDSGSEIQVNHPVDKMLRKRVSREWDSFQFRETLLHWALRYGNGYAEIERDVMGRPLALWPIHPDRVLVARRSDTYEIVYRVRNDGGSIVDFPQMDIFHLRGFGEGVVGLNVVAYAAESLGWARATQLFGASFFGRSMNPSGIVTIKDSLSPDAMAAARKEFRKLYGGPSRSNEMIFLDNGMEYQSVSTEPEKSQFLQTNHFLIEEGCRWFGVPPHKAHHLLRATFSNIEHQSIEVVQDSIMPWSKRFQNEADFKLLGENRQNLTTMMDFDELLRADTATRLTFHTGMRNIGAMNANEIRDREGLNGIGPEGDKYTIQSGFTTLDKVGEEPKPEPVVEPEPEPVPEDDDESEEEIARSKWTFWAKIERSGIDVKKYTQQAVA